MLKYDCIVVGAGASGMMAAIMSARSGKKVAIVDHKPEVGKKILQTGNGRCNYTNMNMKADLYPKHIQREISEALKLFSLDDTFEFFKSIGIFPRQRNGYVYPYSETALSIRNALWDELKRLDVSIYTGTEVEKITKIGEVFSIYISTKIKDGNKEKQKKNELEGGNLIMATGAKASPKSGSDGSGYKLIKEFSLKFLEPYPALVKLSSSDKYNKLASGVRHTSSLSLFIDGEEVAKDMGEIQFTSEGISGIPVFQVSRYVTPALRSKRKVVAILDLMPEFKEEGLVDMFTKSTEIMGNRSLSNFFGGFLPTKLVAAIAGKSSIGVDRKMRDISKDKLLEFIANIKAYKVEIDGTGGFDLAQVCGGGISLKEVDISSMEAKKVKNLYLVGEILDVDGPCGGYNLQWAWTSGAIAGKSVGGMGLK